LNQLNPISFLNLHYTQHQHQPTAMAAKKVLVVFGATGVQGGSVAKAILGDAKLRDSWTVRGVTRDVSKASAKALESLGAETVAVRHKNQIIVDIRLIE
jgi:hypothetical protein